MRAMTHERNRCLQLVIEIATRSQYMTSALYLHREHLHEGKYAIEDFTDYPLSNCITTAYNHATRTTRLQREQPDRYEERERLPFQLFSTELKNQSQSPRAPTLRRTVQYLLQERAQNTKSLHIWIWKSRKPDDSPTLQPRETINTSTELDPHPSTLSATYETPYSHSGSTTLSYLRFGRASWAVEGVTDRATSARKNASSAIHVSSPERRHYRSKVEERRGRYSDPPNFRGYRYHAISPSISRSPYLVAG